MEYYNTVDDHHTTRMGMIYQDIQLAYRIMSRNSHVILCDQIDDCIHAKNNYDNSCQNIKIIYSGLLKTNYIMEQLQMYDIKYTVAYNLREISSLEKRNLKYLLKIKIDANHIGIFDKNLEENIQKINPEYFEGICITMSKKYIINDVYLREYHRLGYSSRELYRYMYQKIKYIIDIFINNNIELKYLLIDILDENDMSDNYNRSNIMFKMSIFNYVNDNNLHNCAIL